MGADLPSGKPGLGALEVAPAEHQDLQNFAGLGLSLSDLQLSLFQPVTPP